jgi:hypothetical protein
VHLQIYQQTIGTGPDRWWCYISSAP